ncbi:hypothetical protein BH09MYX1_BH09MYX1_08780 [soil metagenome]
MKLAAASVAVCALLTASIPAAASETPTRITVHHDGSADPAVDAISRFFTLGEPMAYVDWLCLETNGDRGDAIELELARISVLDENGLKLGELTSASGTHHQFRAFHHALGNGAMRYRYCTRVLPRAWGEDSVRFVATGDASRTTRLIFAIDGDSRGCGGVTCGALEPKLAGFTYGSAAAAFSYGALGFWQSAELDAKGLGAGITRLRVTAFVPLLYIAAGFPKSVRLAAQAGFAFPITIASSMLEGGGSAIGTAIGAYWAQCLELRTAVVPRLCLGAEVDAALEGALRGGALDDVRPRLVFSWYLALGAGPR